MPSTMINTSDKSSALGNVFNNAVSSADGVNPVRTKEGAESDGAEKSVPFQEILGQEMTRDASCSACPPEKSGKAVETPGATGTQEDALMAPLLTGGKLPATKLQVSKEGVNGVKQQKGEEINGSIINEQILNSIFSMNMPLQLATGDTSNPQTIEGESGLQMGDTITGNVANASSILFTSTMGMPMGNGNETGNAPSMVDNQTLLATAGKGVSTEGLNLSTSASAAFVKDATVGIAPKQGNAPSMVDNQTLLATAGKGVSTEGLNLSTAASAAFVKDATVEIVAGQGSEPSMASNQTLLATAGKGTSVDGLNLLATSPTPFVKKSATGLNSLSLLQLLRDGQLPASLIEIRGRELQVPNTGVVMNRMPGFYELPIQNTSQGGERVFSMQTMLNALRMAETSGVKVAPDAQGNASVEMAATNAFQITKEPNAVSGFSPELGAADATALTVAAHATQVSPSLTVNEQPAKELLLPDATGLQQGKHIHREDGASANAFGSQQDSGQESFDEQPEEPKVLDFASLEASAHKTPVDLSIMANTQPTKGPRSPDHLDLQHNASASQGINTTPSSFIEGGDGVLAHLRHDRTDATGQTPADIMDQLFQRISLATHGGRSEIKIDLTPPELGKVKIHFTEENNEVKAKIFVENAEVKAAIENNLHHLRESIVSSGITIHKLEVYLQNEDTGKQKSLEDFNANNFGRQNQGQRQTGEGRNYFGEEKTDDKVVNRESGANASNYAIDYIS